MFSSPATIFSNVWVASGLFGWFMAQVCKLISSFILRHRLDFSYLVSTGGMPSAHSSAVCALACSVGLTEGFDSCPFALAFAVAAITMFDAATLRLNAGRQARLLNEISQELFQRHRIAHEPLKELLGHTRFEVFMGMIVGICSAIPMVYWMRGLP
jgi:acid phosphatase family membrane protein YuiD